MMKPSVVRNAKRASAKGVKGNLKGEGRLLGGLLVVGGDGVAFEHREAVSKGVGLKVRYYSRFSVQVIQARAQRSFAWMMILWSMDRES